MSKRDLFAPFRPAYAAEEQKHEGPKYWTSIEHKEGHSSVVESQSVEFPNGIAPLGELHRRDALKLAGASLALAGLATACVRRPEEEILAYTQQPEEIIPGVANRYATVMPRATGAVGLVVTAYEGRPTKIEGNPLHPGSKGAADMWAQAEILNLWDPDRSRKPAKDLNKSVDLTASTPATWADWDAFAATHFGAYGEKGGQGLAILTNGAEKPTVARLLAAAKAKWPSAKLFAWDAVAADRAEDAAELAFGPGARVHNALDQAKVIVALDSDFLVDGADSLALAKGFGKRRRIAHKDEAGNMSRLYVVEGVFSTTGANADHRLRLASSKIGAFLQAVAGELAGKHGVVVGELPTGPAPAGAEKMVAAVAADLAKNKGAGVILVGERQPVAVQAYAMALNALLGAADTQLQTVSTLAGAVARTSLASSVAALADALEQGEIETLLVVDCNVVATAPGALKIGEALKKAKTVVHAGLIADETAALSHWHLPLAHFLESWGDATAWDGTAAVVQPLILPIFGARSEVAFFGGLVEGKTDDKALVEATWTSVAAGKVWRKALHDGVLPASPGGRAVAPVPPLTAAVADAAKKLSPAGGKGLEIALTFGTVLDGRLANNPWSIEHPDSMTKLSWDNALVVSPKYAKQNGITSGVKRNGYQADVVKVAVDGRSIEAPTFVLPGLEDNSASLHLGYGRKTGAVGAGVGVDAFPLLGRDGGKLVVATVERTGKQVELASTQDHFSRPGNPFNEVSFADSTAMPADAVERRLGTTFNGKKEVSPVAREGKLTIYKEQGATPWRPRRGDEKAPESEFAHEGDIPANLVAQGTPAHRPAMPLQPTMDITYDGQQWGMVIDLTACIGCNACSIACQAENNVATVGRKQVLLGRELHWMRIDRYFAGDVENPTSVHQPLTCMQCENAPCEPVCPVAATVHDEEGINSMAYNRCIGTRYCANNCPYKVRRYNYLDFTVTGNIYRSEMPFDGRTWAQPSRFEVYKLQRNPNVTVRYRGVMEKCTYCTQRIEAAKVAFKGQGGDRKKLPDGAVVPACAQTCPTEAITFGNINDERSKVHAMKKVDRNYEVLSELNVRPRTTYLARLQNNNPDLEG
ncbi:MAG: 4Fe-4S dicluster domain-containing protein [Deltaproteobacteria bacterium]|nr:4Fe-4S dicluster domain-containing protein [Deltaproteobacteria bacterium]